MKKQSGSVKTLAAAAAAAVEVKAPLPKRQRSGTTTQAEVKIPDSSIQVASEPETIKEEEMKEKKIENNGHKTRKMDDVLSSCHKSKYLPLADGINTSNVYFQPIEVVEAKKSWVDVKMREYFLGGGLIESDEPHTYSMEADDLLRMLYLAEMITFDEAGIQRCTLEQWILDNFSKILEEDSHADYSDRGRIATYALKHCEYLKFGVFKNLECFFQKKCIYDFTEVGDNVILHGENLMGIKTKSARGKFEYMIEVRIIASPIYDDEHAVNLKRDLETGNVPEMH